MGFMFQSLSKYALECSSALHSQTHRPTAFWQRQREEEGCLFFFLNLSLCIVIGWWQHSYNLRVAPNDAIMQELGRVSVDKFTTTYF